MDVIYRIDAGGRKSHAVQIDGQWHRLKGDLFGRYEPGEAVETSELQLLAPIEPSKVVAVGLNYRDHAKEMKKSLPEEPQIFLKPSTAVIGPQEPIVLPSGVGRVDYEAELGIVIRTRAHRVPATEAHKHILGLTCVNDVTARELQTRDVQYTRAKGFDSFSPIGPGIVIGQDPNALNVEGWVNGTRHQASNTRELIFDIEHLVEFISAVMTLLPGDVIATGTPSGVGPITPGDRVVIKVQHVGELANPVVGAS